jgi:uncharacterized membrane protein (UPF0127 family)
LSERPTYTIENLTRGTTLATNVRIAGSSAERRRGLLKAGPLQPGDALWIAPCEAVHTVGMKWPIDVVFIDKNYRVRKVASDVSPWRIAVCWTAASVLELPAGSVKTTATKAGDMLAVRTAVRQ